MKLSQSAPPKMPRRPAMVTHAPAASEIWQALLADSDKSGVRISDQQGPFGELLVLNNGDAPGLQDSAAWLAPLSDLMVLKVSGDDALPFLQGQLTNSLEALSDGMAQRTGLCSPKGRLLADFVAARMGDDFLLLLSAAITESIHKRLAMFVLRAKVTIENISRAAPPFGIVSDRDARPSDWPAVMQLAQDDQGRVLIGLESIQVAGHSQARAIMLMPQQRLLDDVADYQSRGYRLAPTAWWHTIDAVAGIPRIGVATSDAFVPQMINFELVGGVSFQKGCFPGQEVVARTQYLGKLKRRLQAGWIDGNAQAAPGTEVLDADGSAVGTVVVAGPGDAIGLPDQQRLLIEIRLAALENSGHLRIGEQAVTLLALPYEIPVAQRFERPDL